MAGPSMTVTESAIHGRTRTSLAAPSAVLARAWGQALSLSRSQLERAVLERETLAEIPGTRLVERLTLIEHGLVVGRAVAKTSTAPSDLVPHALLDSQDLPVPRLLALVPEFGTVVMEEARGTRLDALVMDSIDGAGADRRRGPAGRAGAALARFHRTAPSSLRHLTMAWLIQRLAPRPADLPRFLARRASELTRRLLAARDPITQEAVLCHRDLHLRQIFDDGAQATIIDLDSVGLAHPALDLANFTVYVAVKNPRLAADIEPAFRAGYREASGRFADQNSADWDSAEAIYRAFTFLRLALKACRTARERGWVRAADLLNSGHAVLGASGIRS